MKQSKKLYYGCTDARIDIPEFEAYEIEMLAWEWTYLQEVRNWEKQYVYEKFLEIETTEGS